MRFFHATVIFLIRMLLLAFVALRALEQRWGSALFFLGFIALMELAEMNERLQSIQKAVHRD